MALSSGTGISGGTLSDGLPGIGSADISVREESAPAPGGTEGEPIGLLLALTQAA